MFKSLSISKAKFFSSLSREAHDNLIGIVIGDLYGAYLASLLLRGHLQSHCDLSLSALMVNAEFLQLWGGVNDLSDECERLI